MSATLVQVRVDFWGQKKDTRYLIFCSLLFIILIEMNFLFHFQLEPWMCEVTFVVLFSNQFAWIHSYYIVAFIANPDWGNVCRISGEDLELIQVYLTLSTSYWDSLMNPTVFGFCNGIFDFLSILFKNISVAMISILL